MYSKEFFKAPKEVKRALTGAATDLYGRIYNYEKQNIAFNRIFNDDKVKYDKHGQFYTFKCQKENMQLRVLYAYIVVDYTPVILIADYIIKKKNNKEYIKKFNEANNWSPKTIYENAICVC